MGLSDYTPPKCNVRKPEKVTFFVDVYVRVELRKMLLNGKEARKERKREEKKGAKTKNSRRQIHSAYTRKKVTKKSTPSKRERHDTKSLCLY